MIADELWLATSAQTLSQTCLSNVCLANDQIVLRFLPSGLTTTNVHKMTTIKAAPQDTGTLSEGESKLCCCVKHAKAARHAADEQNKVVE